MNTDVHNTQRMERLSLAQQIAQLEDVAPIDFDPEDIQVTGFDPGPDLDFAADSSAARAHYFDVGAPSLRKFHDSLSDPKYDGEKTSRKHVLDESDESVDGLASEDADSYGQSSELETRTSKRETGVNRGVDARAPTGASECPSASEQNGDLPSNLSRIRNEDRKKGEAISRQIALWDSLLDARIRLQKSVMAANRLTPNILVDKQFSQNSNDQEVHTSLVTMLEEAQLLSNELFNLQERLLLTNELIPPPPRKRRKSTQCNNLVADYAADLREASHEASEFERIYHPHLVQTLNKWSSKIQAVSPSVLLPSNRNVFSRTTQHIKSAPELIDETLGEHEKVLNRTRIYRGKENRLGVSTTDENGTWEKEEDSEVFDDTDFYHQLLRDIIDARGNAAGGNIDWMAVQKEKKEKKKVDTKASKGRKLRYEVHEKIQNFMVPVMAQGSWHEEQIDELFASLLGKGFEDARGSGIFG